MLKMLLSLAAGAVLLTAAPVQAQVQTIDPDQAGTQPAETVPPPSAEVPAPVSDWGTTEPETDAPPVDAATADDEAGMPASPPAAAPAARTARHEEIVGAAEDLFGRGAEGLGGLIERILRDQGEPTAYISGREAGGALVLGLRYGAGTMRHLIEGDRTVYWTSPTVGIDAGADASKVFVLVYNLHDSDRLFRRFPGAAGNAYFLGGFTAQYLRRGDVVLIPIRLGVGVRLGVNAGYMRFTQRSRIIPF